MLRSMKLLLIMYLFGHLLRRERALLINEKSAKDVNMVEKYTSRQEK